MGKPEKPEGEQTGFALSDRDPMPRKEEVRVWVDVDPCQGLHRLWADVPGCGKRLFTGKGRLRDVPGDAHAFFSEQEAEVVADRVRRLPLKDIQQLVCA